MSLKFNGQTPSKIKLNGNEINKIKYNGNEIYTSVPPIVYPTKGDLIQIDIKGNGTPQQFRVIKKLNDTTFELISMENATTSAFSSSSTNATYQNSTLDNYLNSTWYNTLSITAKNAIVNKTFKQETWYRSTSGSPIYNGKNIENQGYQISLNNASYGNAIERHCYALSVQDIIDYLEVTPQMTTGDTTLNANNLLQMFWNSTAQQSGNVWLSSFQESSTAPMIFVINHYYGYIYYTGPTSSNVGVRPAFQIDLSKIEFTIET